MIKVTGRSTTEYNTCCANSLKGATSAWGGHRNSDRAHGRPQARKDGLPPARANSPSNAPALASPTRLIAVGARNLGFRTLDVHAPTILGPQTSGRGHPLPVARLENLTSFCCVPSFHLWIRPPGRDFAREDPPNGPSSGTEGVTMTTRYAVSTDPVRRYGVSCFAGHAGRDLPAPGDGAGR